MHEKGIYQGMQVAVDKNDRSPVGRPGFIEGE
jgi:hypothetical protein